MKKILITGANSYIGTSLEKWLLKHSDNYKINTVDTIGGGWRKKSFSDYDVVFHVAGITHVRETRKNAGDFYRVNRDLAHDIAQKAKIDGVGQFIFLSSMSVYGMNCGIIDKNTHLNPKNNYAKSKLEAEKLIELLNSDTFKIAILRPPMVYGKGCKGNYPRLVKLAVNLPCFPDIYNQRSMIYIDNLCEFIRLLIDLNGSGLFFPQNREYVCTSEMVRLVSKMHGKNIRLTKLFNPLLRLFNTNTVDKAFGSLVYRKSLSLFEEYQIVSTLESIKKTES